MCLRFDALPSIFRQKMDFLLVYPRTIQWIRHGCIFSSTILIDQMCIHVDYVKLCSNLWHRVNEMNGTPFLVRRSKVGIVFQYSFFTIYIILVLPNRPKQLIVFVNPFGGKGKASSIWEKQVLFILQVLFTFLDIFIALLIIDHAELKSNLCRNWV